MNEEDLKQVIEEGGKIPEPDEIISPQPTRGQEVLWDVIGSRLEESALDREEAFFDLNLELRSYLASLETSRTIRNAASAAGLSKEQAMRLAGVINRFFTEGLTPEVLESTLEKDLSLDAEKAKALKDALAGITQKLTEKREEKNTAVFQGTAIAPELASLAQTRADSNADSRRLPPSAGKEVTPDEERPFMIHEESPDISLAPKASFAIPPSRPKFQREESAPQQKREPKPVTVTIQSPSASKEKPKSRVVHYSNLRTPLEEPESK